MPQITEPDWKVFRQLHPIAVERFSQQTLEEIARVSRDTSQTAHERYLAVYQLIHKRNKLMAFLFDDFRRSTAIQQICLIKQHGYWTAEEFAGFSQETLDLIEMWQR